MLKYVFLAGVMTAAAPLAAQTAPQAGATDPMAAPTQTVPAAPTQQAPVTAADPTQAAPAAQTAPAQTAQATPASGDQVKAVIEAEFATYDKNKDGSLDKTEFAAWMDALKAKQPTQDAAAADPKWNEAAFTQADSDKNKTVTKEELASFLSGAPSAS